MIDAGDIYLADVGASVRRRVLVVSTSRFTSMSGRVLVAPQHSSVVGPVRLPWRISINGSVFAVDLLRRTSADRLLDRTDRASVPEMAAARRAIAQIT